MKARRGVATACFPSVVPTAGPLGRIAGAVGRVAASDSAPAAEN
jgi:hypothetical protein